MSSFDCAFRLCFFVSLFLDCLSLPALFLSVSEPPVRFTHVTVYCSVLQCVAVCCSVLQCVAVCCSVLQCVTVCYSLLQCVPVCCNVLHLVQFVAVNSQNLQCTYHWYLRSPSSSSPPSLPVTLSSSAGESSSPLSPSLSSPSSCVCHPFLSSSPRP